MPDAIELYESITLPDDLSFDEWVNYVFDHPVSTPQWHFELPSPQWNELAQPTRTLEYLTALFSQPEFLIERFSRAQIDQGLAFLVDNSCSDHMIVLQDRSIPWAARRACFDAMIPLYAKLMAPVYGNDIEHNRTTNSPEHPDGPNYACYMWWDIIPVYGGMKHADRDLINNAVLHVFEEVLMLDSAACLESVLHGATQWGAYVLDRTRPLIEEFLKRTDICLELRRYAECFITGCVQ